ncbi:hypothetical protein N7E02_04205 (plasmid) [Aliirhizobium terrae]|uniref:hypothetical protein n=1 Tax=Terrirhizobium terrae TaxID=2926709 RepID=UPI0025782C5E|nr:hypothetical protein [Rhizobium sp. CC-CFT758]WJH38607.1 hypothetical protein N7E02_04205 [Rhizobium sp. CC-CFT758]
MAIKVMAVSAMPEQDGKIHASEVSFAEPQLFPSVGARRVVQPFFFRTAFSLQPLALQPISRELRQPQARSAYGLSKNFPIVLRKAKSPLSP